MYSVVATGRNSLTTHRIAEGLHVYPWSYFNNDKIAGNKRGINIQFCPVNRLKKSQNIRRLSFFFSFFGIKDSLAILQNFDF